MTRVENADETVLDRHSRCISVPGSVGGAEWNGPAYDPDTNLILVGEVDWCTTVTLQTPEQDRRDRERARPGPGEDSINPFNTWGKQDPFGDWAGWVYASRRRHAAPGNGG